MRPDDEVVPEHSGPCSECYRTPTTAATFEWLTGMGILHRRSRRSGRFCRDCGLSVARTTVLHNVRGGWWSPVALFLNPLILWRNHGTSKRIRSTPASPMPRTKLTLDPGRPFYVRFGIVFPVAMIAIVVGLGRYLHDQAGVDDFEVGMCFDLPDDLAPTVSLRACDDPHDAQVTSLLDDKEFERLKGTAAASLPAEESPGARLLGRDPLYEAALGELTNDRCATEASAVIAAPPDSTSIGHLQVVMSLSEDTAVRMGFGDASVICYLTSQNGSPLDRSLLDE